MYIEIIEEKKNTHDSSIYSLYEHSRSLVRIHEARFSAATTRPRKNTYERKLKLKLERVVMSYLFSERNISRAVQIGNENSRRSFILEITNIKCILTGRINLCDI